MKVTLHKSKFEERLLRLSVLRAGYLAGIAVAGYRWVPIWDPIRRQILDSTTDNADLSGLVRYERQYPRDRRALGIVGHPIEMRSVYVGFGRWTVFLPMTRESVLFRPNTLAGKRVEFSGSAYHWPTAPSFGIDWMARRAT